MTKQKTLKFDAYPTRSITMSDEVWEEFKNAKLKFGGNWNKFIKALIEKYGKD